MRVERGARVPLLALGVRRAAGGGDALVDHLVGTGLFDFGSWRRGRGARG
jgi:hypothetical protein